MSLNEEDKYLIAVTFDKFEAAGLTMSEEQQQSIANLKKEIADAGKKWLDVFYAVAGSVSITLTAEEADSLPAHLKEALTEEGGSYKASGGQLVWKIADAAPMEDVRKRAFEAASTFPPESIELLRSIFKARLKLAQVYGKSSWMDYTSSKAMPGSIDEVRRFLGVATAGVAEKFAEEKAHLEELKFADTGSREVHYWDAQYYVDKFTAANLPEGASSLNEFFELEHTVKATLDLFSELLSLRFQEIPNVPLPGGEGKAYYVTDKVTSEPFGTLVLDLLERDGKNSGWAERLRDRRMVGGRLKGKALTFVSLFFSRPTQSMPTLLSPSSVGVLFHELGHALQMLTCTSKYASAFNAWSADSVEVASMLMENLSKSPEVLSRIASHYADPSKKLSVETVKKIQAASKVFMTVNDTGWFVAKANQDLEFSSYTDESQIPQDLNEVAREIYGKTAVTYPEGKSNLPWFGHLTLDQYFGAYYGYLWSEAIAKDMLGVITRDGVLNQQSWEHFRKTFLRSNVSGAESVRNFLGRSWDFAAYESYMRGE